MSLDAAVFTVEAVRATLADDERAVFDIVDSFLLQAEEEGIEFADAAGALLRDAYGFGASAIESLGRVIQRSSEDVLDAYVVHAMDVL